MIKFTIKFTIKHVLKFKCRQIKYLHETYSRKENNMYLDITCLRKHCKTYLNSVESIQIYKELNIPVKGMLESQDLIPKITYHHDINTSLNLPRFYLCIDLGLDKLKGVYDLRYLPYMEEYKLKFLQEEFNLPLLKVRFPDCPLLNINNSENNKKEYSESECCICLEKSDNYTNCGHNTCFPCIEKCDKIICPVCKTKITDVSGNIKRTVIKESYWHYKFSEDSGLRLSSLHILQIMRSTGFHGIGLIRHVIGPTVPEEPQHEPEYRHGQHSIEQSVGRIIRSRHNNNNGNNSTQFISASAEDIEEARRVEQLSATMNSYLVADFDGDAFSSYSRGSYLSNYISPVSNVSRSTMEEVD
jgi:hypothetical protein